MASEPKITEKLSNSKLNYRESDLAVTYIYRQKLNFFIKLTPGLLQSKTKQITNMKTKLTINFREVESGKQTALLIPTSKHVYQALKLQLQIQ